MTKKISGKAASKSADALLSVPRPPAAVWHWGSACLLARRPLPRRMPPPR